VFPLVILIFTVHQPDPRQIALPVLDWAQKESALGFPEALSTY
jgi:hypothetical protein